MKKGLFTLLLLIITALPALAAPGNTSGPWGVHAGAFRNLSTALASPATVGKTVVVSTPMTINNKTLPADRHIKIIRGGSINPAVGKTFNFSGQSPDAGLYRIYAGSGVITGLHRAAPEHFGANADGNDDLAAINSMMASGAQETVFTPGRTYRINGTTTSSLAGRKIVATGATIKQITGAASRKVIDITGAGTTITGGTWDGNADADAVSDPYSGYCIGVLAANCTVTGTIIQNSGSGIKIANADNTTLHNNKITIAGTYGIYGEAVGIDMINASIYNNFIDVSSAGDDAQGVLLTAGTGYYQKYWAIRNNYINSPTTQTLTSGNAINIGVRGTNGIVSGNTTRGGTMGFSEGGDYTVISDNRFLDIIPTAAASFGIEAIGSYMIVSNNIVTGAYYGVCSSGNRDMIKNSITGNTFNVVQRGIYVRIITSYSGADWNIANNTINTTLAAADLIYLTGNLVNINISGNSIAGIDKTNSASVGIYFDTPPADLYASIIGNSISGVFRPVVVYSAAVSSVSNIALMENAFKQCGSSSAHLIGTDASITIGANVSVSGYVTSRGNRLNIIDQLKAIYLYWDIANFNTPEANYTAGIGSIAVGINGTMWTKTSGTGNTGWNAASATVYTATTAQLAAIGDAINTTVKTTGKAVWNTSTLKYVYATGSAAGSVWNDAVGVLAHTPI